MGRRAGPEERGRSEHQSVVSITSQPGSVVGRRGLEVSQPVHKSGPAGQQQKAWGLGDASPAFGLPCAATARTPPSSVTHALNLCRPQFPRLQRRVNTGAHFHGTAMGVPGGNVHQILGNFCVSCYNYYYSSSHKHQNCQCLTEQGWLLRRFFQPNPGHFSVSLKQKKKQGGLREKKGDQP